MVFPRRPGGQSQFSAFVTYREAVKRPEIQELNAWILGHPGEDLSVQALANRMGMSPRNFARLFRNETGESPGQFVERARADAASQRHQPANIRYGPRLPARQIKWESSPE